MKIYNKRAFFAGLFFAGTFLLFVLGIIEAELWQWLLAFGLAARSLHIGLSETGSRREAVFQRQYPNTVWILPFFDERERLEPRNKQNMDFSCCFACEHLSFSNFNTRYRTQGFEFP